MGIVRNADGCVHCCNVECANTPTPTPRYDSQGREIFELVNGSQFIIVIEAARGLSGDDIGESLLPLEPSNRPDLQVEATRPLGNGSSVVCDVGAPPSGGGIPAINPPSYAEMSPFISNALSDFACRFEVRERSEACTIMTPQRIASTISPLARQQFCDQVAQTAAFPQGDTVLTAKVRDVGGQLGPAAQIIVRVTGGGS